MGNPRKGAAYHTERNTGETTLRATASLYKEKETPLPASLAA